MMILANLMTCLLATTLGLYALWRYLNIFNANRKTPLAHAWLVLVGTLAWSVFSMMALEILADDWLTNPERMQLYGGNVFARALFFIFWCGYLLQVKQHCRNRLKRQLKQKLQGAQI